MGHNVGSVSNVVGDNNDMYNTAQIYLLVYNGLCPRTKHNIVVTKITTYLIFFTTIFLLQ